MSSKLRQAGFSAVEVVMVVVILGVIAGVGYYLMQKNTVQKTVDTTQNTSTNVPSAPEVKNTSDLTEAEKALDETELDASNSDSTELNAELNSF